MTARPSSARKKVLVIDDELSILAYLTTVLEDNGYETCSVADAEAALATAREQSPDLITLDIMMPRRSGVALYQELKLDPKLRKIPVVFLSAFSRSSTVGPASFRKMIPDERVPVPEVYLEKPVVVSEFLRTVASLLESAEIGSGSGEGGRIVISIKHWIRNELFDQVPISICVIDRDYKIVEANRTFSETFGAWQDRHCFSVYKNRSERCEDCGAAECFRDGKVRIREEPGVAPSEGKPTHYLVRTVPLTRMDGEIRYIIEMSADISEMKRLQQEKLVAERLAAVGQTVAGLAHGIKNLIMGLEGGMYVVSSGIRRNNSEKIRQGWDILEENITRISSFAREFLDFARGRTPHVAMVNPNQIAHEVIGLFRDTAAQSGIRLQADLAENLLDAPLDREGIHTCLANLVSNALDACEMSNKQDRHVVLTTRERDGTLTYEVTDDGCGMEYDVKQKVFTNFFSTKESGKGTGLGLLTTQKIVQEHGGKVSFESTEGEGSVFRLEFPRSRLPEAANDVSAGKGA